MFIVELTYKVELDIVDKFVAEHRIWLDEMYKRDYFLCSGVKNPRDGGIIIALIKSLDELKELVYKDPFYINEVANYRIIEFSPSKYHTEFTRFIEL